MSHPGLTTALVIAAAIWTAGTMTAGARIGESVEECQARYGPPVERRPPTLAASDPEMLVYSKSSITILVEFREGRAWSITFRRPSTMTHAELDSLLAVNAGDKKWSQPVKIGGTGSTPVTEFRLAEGRSLLATTHMDGKERPVALVVISQEFAEANRAQYLANLARFNATPDAGSSRTLPGF